jgi:hypothetical protein
MTTDKLSSYKIEFDKLFAKTLFSYPFYDKTDEELIADATNKNHTDFDFGLFKLGNRDKKIVVVAGKEMETHYIPLVFLNGDKNNFIEIKLSSFVFPCFLPSFYNDVDKLRNKKKIIKSTYKLQTFSSYSSLYQLMEKDYGHNILVTTCWSALNNFGRLSKCVNLMPIANDVNAADFIRYYFKEERIRIINEILDIPYKYFGKFPIDADIANQAFLCYKERLEAELLKLSDYEVDLDRNKYDYYDGPTQKEIDKDYFDAMTDGQEGDFESYRSYGNDDD